MSKVYLRGLFLNYKLYLGLIILLSFLTKLFNLNYNSLSSDEAVYVAIGNSILFKWNWAVYNTASWVGGHTYFYPILSSISHYYNGAIGARLLNIVFLSLATYFTYQLTNRLALRMFGGLFKRRTLLVSLLSSVVVAFSATSFYISRLATYDMGSFALLTVGIYYLVLSSENKFDDNSKAVNFFLSALFLSLSFAFKYITIIYLPLIVIVSYLFINKHFKKSLIHFWKFYFLTPLIITLLTLSLTQFQHLQTFVGAQITREHMGALEIITEFIRNTYYLIPVFILGAYGLGSKKHWKLLAAEILSILTIVAFHVVTNRTSALDKHSFIIVFTVAVFGSVGIYEVIKKRVWRYIISAFIILYIPFNMYIANKYNYLWPNFGTAINYLEDNMKSTDRLLSENGSSIILTTYEGLSPHNVVTFDWFEYKNKTGEAAYRQAITEGYFSFIELETNSYTKPEGYALLNSIVQENLDNNYSVVIENKDYMVYKRNF